VACSKGNDFWSTKKRLFAQMKGSTIKLAVDAVLRDPAIVSSLAEATLLPG
jgi:hypothetical protein